MMQELEEGKSIYQGRSLGLRVDPKEKSAEVIVPKGNELGQCPRGLTIREGLNVVLFKIRIGTQLV